MNPVEPRLPWLAGAAGGVLLLGAIGIGGGAGVFGSAGVLGMPGAPGVASAAPPPMTERFHGGGLGSVFPDGAPARVAGGFGGDTCLACHWEFEDEVDSRGSLRVSGLPEAWTPGETYTLEIEVKRPGMAVGGFQIAARFAADTTQAGSFRIPDAESGRIAILDEGGLFFAQHTEAGTPADEETGVATWTIVWRAPGGSGSGTGSGGRGGGQASTHDQVVLNVSAVAGDGDRSQMGDYVYSAEFRVGR